MDATLRGELTIVGRATFVRAPTLRTIGAKPDLCGLKDKRVT